MHHHSRIWCGTMGIVEKCLLAKAIPKPSFAFQPQLIWFDRFILWINLGIRNQGKPPRCKVKRQLTWFANVQE